MHIRVVLVSSVALIVGAAVLKGCNSDNNGIASYDDCILENANSVKNEQLLKTIKNSCKRKFPRSFDFDQIAAEANVDSWRSVVQKKEYQSKSQEVKDEIANEYFRDVIARRVHPDYLPEASAAFASYAQGIKRKLRSSNKEPTTETEERAPLAERNEPTKE